MEKIFEVWRITRKQPLNELLGYEDRLKHFEPNMLKSRGYKTLDHKISVWHGWRNGISAEVIGNIDSLRYIDAVDNARKGRDSVFF